MYLWKIDNLVEDFKNDRVSQKDQLGYFLVYTLLTIIFADPYFYEDTKSDIYSHIITAVLAILVAFWIYKLYKINSSGDDRDFIVRFICLSLPASIRVTTYIMPLIVILGFIYGITLAVTENEINIESDLNSFIFELLFSITFITLMMIYMGKKIKQISHKK